MLFKRILVATDGSVLADRAVVYAIDLAACGGAALIALQVQPRYQTAAYEGFVAFEVEDVARAERQASDRVQSTLAAVRAQAEAAGVPVQTVTLTDDHVADAIVATAGKYGVDLIVLGSHSRHGLERLLMGSRAERVLKQAQVPVLVLP